MPVQGNSLLSVDKALEVLEDFSCTDQTCSFPRFHS